MEKRYRVYSKYLKEKYGAKTYKLPVKLDITCPNRDGTKGRGGCIFCGEQGGSFENLSEDLAVKEQLLENKDYMASRFGAKKFIAYFQNFSNTYLPLRLFKKAVEEALIEDIVAVTISTRPDCVNEKHLSYLDTVQERGIDVNFELGLQSAKNESLRYLNRGHTVADYVRAALAIKKHGFTLCTHMIIGIPTDERADIIEGARLISYLGTDEVKIHSLYIPKHTKLAKMYENGEADLISLEEYVDLAVLFLRYTDPSVAVQRLVGRMPEKDTVFCNWDRSWWVIRDMIEEKMEEDYVRQGDLLKKDGILIE